MSVMKRSCQGAFSKFLTIPEVCDWGRHIKYDSYQHPPTGLSLEAFADLKVAGGDLLEGAGI